MVDLHALMEDAFIKWNEENFVLLRIRVIVGFLMVLYLIMFAFSGLTYLSTRISMLSLLDAVSEAVLAYTLGAMQAASLNKPMFSVWALALVSFRSSISSLHKYGTFSELRNVLKLSAVAFLNVKHGSKVLRIPFWSFWSLLLLKCLYRVVALRQASKSMWHARSSEVLQCYMGHNQSKFNPEISCNLETMEGYKYLVYYGSSKQRKRTGHTVSVNDLRSVVTLDKIWQSEMWQSHANGCNMKHLSLAFALSLLLRCRLEGAKLHAATVLMTKKLICSLISTSNAERKVFSMLENDLLFLKQYLHTGHPMVFSQGLFSLFFTLILCTAKFCVATWMALFTTKEYYPSAAVGGPKFSGKLSSADATDFVITLVAIGFVSFMEIWEGVTYVFSKWTVLLLICNYAHCSSSAIRHVTGNLLTYTNLGSICASHVEDTGRYDFLQSFTKLSEQHGCLPSVKSLGYSVWKWNLVAYEVVGIELPGSWKRFKNVKAALIHALSRSMDIKGNHLQRELPWPSVSGRKERYWSASLELPPRCSHVILVWHIATSLCELKLAQDRGIDLRNKPGLFSFLEDDKQSLAGDLQKMHTVANCLSQYCAYLLVSKPELLPDPILVTKKVLVDTVQLAQEMLEQCDSLQDRYDTLIPPGAIVLGSHDIKLSGDILEQGAMLANELIHEGEEERWEILAEVWADLLVHIAPSPNAEAHAKNLELGDELITLIWALLCHCGIEKSKLWPDDLGAEQTIQGHLSRNSCAGACVQQMPTPAPPADPGHSQRGHIEEVQDIAAGPASAKSSLQISSLGAGARAQQVATPAPSAATRDTHSGDIEDVEDIEIITETGPTSSPTS